MAWITVRYRPGFGADLTSWETRIEQDGALSQTLRIARFSECVESRTDLLSAHLLPEQVAYLRDLIAKTHFSVTPSMMTDYPYCFVTVHQTDAVLHLEAPLYVADLLPLWQTLDAVSPFGIHSRPLATAVRSKPASRSNAPNLLP